MASLTTSFTTSANASGSSFSSGGARPLPTFFTSTISTNTGQWSDMFVLASSDAPLSCRMPPPMRNRSSASWLTSTLS